MLFEEDALKGNQKKKGKPFSSINDILYVSGHVYERGPPRDLSFRREVHLIHTHTHTHTYTPPSPSPRIMLIFLLKTRQNFYKNEPV